MNTIPPRYDFTDADLQQILAKAEAHNVRSMGEFADAVVDRLENGNLIQGIKLPWSRTHPHIRLRKGEVSIWCGINGHKKSTLLNQVALWATKECPVGIASLEMPVDSLATLMVTQAAGNGNPAKQWATDLIQKLGRRVWFYDRLGSVPPIEILGAVHALHEQGCELIVIDSLSMCRVSDDLERERLFMSELVSLAKALNVHVCLVHHVRKPQSGGDEYVPTRFDLKGSGSIADLAQNIFIVWSNKLRDLAIRKQRAGISLDKREQEALDSADLRLIVAKQRHAEFEGPISLWGAPGRQFVANRDGRAVSL